MSVANTVTAMPASAGTTAMSTANHTIWLLL